MLLLGKALDSSFYAVAVDDSVRCYSNRFAWWLALATKYSCCTQVERRTEHFTLAPWGLHGNAVKTQHAQLRNPLDKVCCYKTLYYSLTADWLSTRPTRTNKMHFWRTRNEVPVYFLLTVQHICVKVIAAVVLLYFCATSCGFYVRLLKGNILTQQPHQLLAIMSSVARAHKCTIDLKIMSFCRVSLGWDFRFYSCTIIDVFWM